MDNEELKVIPWKVSAQQGLSGAKRFVLHIALDKTVISGILDSVSNTDYDKEWSENEKEDPATRYKNNILKTRFRLGSDQDMLCIEFYDSERCPLENTAFGVELDNLRERQKSGLVLPNED